jgi:hypothetical protein
VVILGNVDESVKNKLSKSKLALLLGASDMTQAIAAARALQVESDGTLARVFETAMVVCFMRPFTGSLRLPEEYGRPGPGDAEFFRDIKRLRDKVYAHTDEGTGREASHVTVEYKGEIVNLGWKEAWTSFPRDRLEFFIGICERLKENMHIDASKAQLILDGKIPLDRWGQL